MNDIPQMSSAPEREPVTPADDIAQQLVETFCQTYPFPLDDFQIAAIEQIARGQSVLVAAPTGTGKTIVAEAAIWMALREGRRVFYTAPLKALSNQKFRDFRERYGDDQVGLMTGDIVENASAPIVVMTTEIYRNVLLELERQDESVALTELAHSVAETANRSGTKQLDPQLARVGWIVFDELHFMADPQRGPVWEECIIHSPPHVRFVGLSATVANADELVAWMSQIHAPTKLIFHPERAIPLEDFYFFDNTLHLVRDANGQRVARFPHIGGEAKRRGYYGRRYSESDEEDDGVPFREAPAPPEVLVHLRDAGMLPCLYFLPGRKAVEEAAHSAVDVRLTSPEEHAAIAVDVQQAIQSLSAEDRTLQQVMDLADLLPRGLAYHHAGLLPSLKILVETLFARGSLRAVFATDTLALGVNMPARAVVLGSLSKFDGVGMRLMTPNEYNQLTGRAGRRGKDARGAAVILYSPWEAFEECFKELTRPLNPVNSAFSMRYNSVLNLWRPFQFERLRRIGAASFLEFQRRARKLRSLARKQDYDAKKRAKGTKKGKKDTAVAQEQQRVPQDGAHPAPADLVELSGGVEHELLATTTVLRIFGYIDEQTDALTMRGRLLRAIFHPAGLILTELMLSGALDDLTSNELGEVISWFVYDSDRPLWTRDVLTDRLRLARRAARTMAERVRKTEIRQDLSPSPTINDQFMGVALGWSQGLSLAALRGRISLAEGDLLMILNQSIDLLRQLESAIRQILDDASLWTAEGSNLTWLDRRDLRQRLDKLRAGLGLAARSLLRSTVAQSRTLPFKLAGLPAPPEDAAAEAEISSASSTPPAPVAAPPDNDVSQD
jgi:ATP-dependent RNA helicase HelY